MENILSYTLDTSEEWHGIKKCKQLDNRPMVLTIYDRGQIYDFTETTLELRALKNDGTFVIQTNNITVSANIVTINPINIDMVRVAGVTRFELKITKDNLSITTFVFDLLVLPTTLNGAVESENVVTILEQLDTAITSGQATLTQVNQAITDLNNLITSGGAVKVVDYNVDKAAIDTTLGNKVDKVTGKGLSTNDYTTADKTEVAKVVNKADKSYVDTLAASLANGSPKGVYATLSALQSAIPSGNTNIYVTSDNGNWNYWNGSTWVSGGTYQSTGIANNTISPSKTTFAIRTTNLFNKDAAVTGSFINGSVATVDSRYAYSDYISIINGGTYTISSDTPSNLGAIYDINKNFLALLPTGETTGNPKTITINIANAAYMRVNMLVGEVQTYIISEGTELLSASTVESVKIKNLTLDETTNLSMNTLKDGSIAVKKTDFASITGNLFNPNKVTLDGFINSGTFQALSGYACSDYIPIKNGSTYAFSDSFPQNYGSIYDDDKNFLTILPLGVSDPGSAVTPRTITINTPKAAYIRINLKYSRVGTNNYMVYENSLPAVYTPYSGIKIADLQLINENIPESVLNYIVGLIGGNRWINKKGVFDGDSITQGNTINGVPTSYPDLVKNLMQLNSASNKAVSGSSLSVISGRRNLVSEMNNLDTDGDFYYISAGINDYMYSAPLGTESSTDTASFWGALNTMMETLMTKFPTKTIVFATPIHKGGDTASNSVGCKLIDYVNAIRQAGEKWGIPICDMYCISGLNPNVTAQKDAVFYPDNIHPYTVEGMNRMAQRVAGYMKNI
ncbi:SGNH/GDSL hydrolase family protein [Clostridium sp. HBUAS56017]|uniref:SGNH/GDSL hydrolase family protein n=1 Tax=Clostridium sp. HBUAS56017 TaxID=2571128 RepID=UPI001177EDA6|nr:SGNH/GDSL hydrolase family protein [Clostridium sp. HBUAS56017]